LELFVKSIDLPSRREGTKFFLCYQLPCIPGV
jgi:hypothetical protein